MLKLWKVQKLSEGTSPARTISGRKRPLGSWCCRTSNSIAALWRVRVDDEIQLDSIQLISLRIVFDFIISACPCREGTASFGDNPEHSRPLKMHMTAFSVRRRSTFHPGAFSRSSQCSRWGMRIPALFADTSNQKYSGNFCEVFFLPRDAFEEQSGKNEKKDP